jgi:hypothetical protein
MTVADGFRSWRGARCGRRIVARLGMQNLDQAAADDDRVGHMPLELAGDEVAREHAKALRDAVQMLGGKEIK